MMGDGRKGGLASQACGHFAREDGSVVLDQYDSLVGCIHRLFRCFLMEAEN
jgi:hypothetical protein